MKTNNKYYVLFLCSAIAFCLACKEDKKSAVESVSEDYQTSNVLVSETSPLEYELSEIKRMLDNRAWMMETTLRELIAESNKTAKVVFPDLEYLMLEMDEYNENLNIDTLREYNAKMMCIRDKVTVFSPRSLRPAEDIKEVVILMGKANCLRIYYVSQTIREEFRDKKDGDEVALLAAIYDPEKIMQVHQWFKNAHFYEDKSASNSFYWFARVGSLSLKILEFDDEAYIVMGEGWFSCKHGFTYQDSEERGERFYDKVSSLWR